MGENAAATNHLANISLCSQKIDLNGKSQRVPRLIYECTYSDWKTFEIKNSSAMPATLTVTEGREGDGILGGGSSGPITFVYDASSGASFGITNGDHRISGPLVVSNGTLAVHGSTFANVRQVVSGKTGAKFYAEDASFPALERLDLGTGARAELVGATTLPENAVIDTAADAVLTLGAGVMIVTDSATIRGTKLKPGKTYTGGSGVAGLEGAGSIVIPGREEPDDPRVWDAGGGTSTGLDVAENWAGDSVPDLEEGGLVATFARGNEATLSGDAAMRGASLVSADGDFTIAGVGELTLGKYGFTVTNGVQTVAVPVSLSGGQTWTVDGLSTTLALTGGILAGEGWPFTKGGVGILELSGDSSAYSGTITCTAGTLRIVGENGVGPATALVLKPQSMSVEGKNSRALLSLSNAVVGAALKVQTVTAGTSALPDVFSEKCSTNLFASTVTCTRGEAGSEMLQVKAGEGSKVLFERAVSSAGGIAISGNGECWFEGGVVGSNYRFDSGSAPHVHLYGFVSGNAQTVNCYQGNYPTIHCHAENVLGTSSARFQYIGPKCMVTNVLHGFDQTVSMIDSAYHPSNVVWKTEEPATLTLGFMEAYTPHGWAHYEGNLSLDAKLVGTHTFHQETSATGGVTCTTGTLVFGEGAVFRATTNLVVKKGAHMTVSSSANLPRLPRGLKRSLSVADGGVFELGAGVQLKVAAATVGDKFLKCGVYGSSRSSAPAGHQDDEHFAGSGVLVVGGCGLTIIVR